MTSNISVTCGQLEVQNVRAHPNLNKSETLIIIITFGSHPEICVFTSPTGDFGTCQSLRTIVLDCAKGF